MAHENAKHAQLHVTAYLQHACGNNHIYQASLFDAPSLKKVWIDGPLRGTLPNSLCDSTDLDVVQITDNNALEGSLPQCIGKLSKVDKLFMYSNPNLGGKVPPLPLNLLRDLDMQSNGFDGVFPLVENAKFLRGVIVSQNKLSGMAGFINAPKLQSIDARNNLIERMPRFVNLAALQILALDRNRISSDFPLLDGITSLQKLSITANKFNGA